MDLSAMWKEHLGVEVTIVSVSAARYQGVTRLPIRPGYFSSDGQQI